ncbi:STAS domain-containing protein [Chitinibacter tainanensis]|uniref:STAS domain-containing protein n=1 Tax=Chitinibacter tainanensis TaxID=230667 RepID=UPI0003FCAE97|nr:STAS domain-containing protein [Chitinibacter tainanensis]
MQLYPVPATLTHASTPALLGALDGLLAAGDLTLDLQAVTTLDSSAVALLLEWRRRAQARQRQLSYQGCPAALGQLIRVYGVQDLLQIKV